MTPNVDAVVALLRAYLAFRATLPDGTMLMDSLWDAAWDGRESAATQVELLLEHPVRSALKGEVREIGWRVSATGGLAAMRALCEQVEAAMGSDGEWAGNTLEAWWHRIGSPERGVWLA